MPEPYTNDEIKTAAATFLGRVCPWKDQCLVFGQFLADRPNGAATAEEIEKWVKEHYSGEQADKISGLSKALPDIECKSMLLALIDVRDDVALEHIRAAVPIALSMVQDPARPDACSDSSCDVADEEREGDPAV